jgi:hypothetical protein
MANEGLFGRFDALSDPRGPCGRTLRLGSRAVRIEGLDAPLAAELDERWGGFVERPATRRADLRLDVLRGPTEGWLEPRRAAEAYRMESLGDGPRRLVLSYNFAVWPGDAADEWRVAVRPSADEPASRILDNTARFLGARLAVADGGFAMHAAGVLREGRAHLLAGPSGAGKSTAVGLVAPAASLGDDLGLVTAGAGGWVARALPFDTSERAPRDADPGPFPLARIWRLHKSDRTRAEPADGALAVTSLMGCVAFPWVLPDLADPLLDNVRRCVTDGCFGHLHFTRDEPLWSHLV